MTLSTDSPKKQIPSSSRRPLALLGILSLAGGIFIWQPWQHPDPSVAASPAIPEDTAIGDLPAANGGDLSSWLQVQCAVCHQFPDPSILPRQAWRPMLTRMQEISPIIAAADLDQMVDWYEQRAPQKFTPPYLDPSAIGTAGIDFEVISLSAGTLPTIPATSNVRFVDLSGDGSPELLITDMANGTVLAVSFGEDGSHRINKLADVPHPAGAEVVDLDQDGKLDLLVADLGSFRPADHQLGRALWLRATGDGYQTVVIASGLGRVADVEAADLDGDGDLDIVVEEFGARSSKVLPGESGMTGGLWLLENQTTDWAKPKFVRRELDPRAGGVDVDIADIDGDGHLDIVRLITQHHERLSVLYGRGGLKFAMTDAFIAPHPAWGYIDLQLVDADGDSDLDMLLSNGDGFDSGGLMQPFHGLQLIENLDDRKYHPHPLLPLPGVHGSEMADMDGDGDLDIVASAFQPFLNPVKRRGLASVVWFECTAPWTFTRHILKMHEVDHPTLSLADYDRDGDVDIALGFYSAGKKWTAIKRGSSLPPAIILKNKQH